MSTGEPTDVTSTLTDLERKLVELERELSAVTTPPATAGAPAPVVAPPTPADTHRSALRVEDLRGEIADLVRFRDQLEAAAKELVEEYDRLVERLKGSAPAAPAAPATPPAPAPAPEAGPIAPGPAPAQTLPPAVAARIPGAAPAAPETDPGDDTSFVGAVVIDAGPFGDITTLQSFEQGLARVDGAEDVYVRSFEGNRALIDVRLSNPVPLVQLLRNQLPLPISTREAGEGRLTIDVADSHGT